jgi:hypothetical protein
MRNDKPLTSAAGRLSLLAILSIAALRVKEEFCMISAWTSLVTRRARQIAPRAEPVTLPYQEGARRAAISGAVIRFGSTFGMGASGAHRAPCAHRRFARH